MTILRVQHAVANFDGWKRAFESDPIDRKGSGVQRYSVHCFSLRRSRSTRGCVRPRHVWRIRSRTLRTRRTPP